MTEDLIAMAREAGFLYFNSGQFSEHGAIRRFAALIEARAVARTREECAALCDSLLDDLPSMIGLPAPAEPGSVLDDQQRSFVGGAGIGAIACAGAIRALGERT